LLRNYLSKFIDFPIKTSLEKGQPRLLLTSVDIQDYTISVVFDSYEKLHHAPVRNNNNTMVKEKDNKDKDKWYSEYGNSDNRHFVFYDGIGPDQILASALGKYAIDHPHMEDMTTHTMRQLWDGGYINNTPLRELLAAHKNFGWNIYGIAVIAEMSRLRRPQSSRYTLLTYTLYHQKIFLKIKTLSMIEKAIYSFMIGLLMMNK
jgi:NTE family protein